MRATVLAATALALLSAPLAAQSLSVNRSLNVVASPERVWELIGDFCDIQEWHSVIASCTLVPGDGKQRLLTTGDGGELVERETARDQYSYSYVILTSPLPVADYASTLSVAANDGGSTVMWQGRFAAAEGVEDAQATEVMEGVYDAGMEGIGQLVGEDG